MVALSATSKQMFIDFEVELPAGIAKIGRSELKPYLIAIELPGVAGIPVFVS